VKGSTPNWRLAVYAIFIDLPGEEHEDLYEKPYLLTLSADEYYREQEILDYHGVSYLAREIL